MFARGRFSALASNRKSCRSALTKLIALKLTFRRKLAAITGKKAGCRFLGDTDTTASYGRLKARGVKMGGKPKLTSQRRAEAASRQREGKHSRDRAEQRPQRRDFPIDGVSL
jgi:hypothetical protein